MIFGQGETNAARNFIITDNTIIDGSSDGIACWKDAGYTLSGATISDNYIKGKTLGSGIVIQNADLVTVTSNTVDSCGSFLYSNNVTNTPGIGCPRLVIISPRKET